MGVTAVQTALAFCSPGRGDAVLDKVKMATRVLQGRPPWNAASHVHNDSQAYKGSAERVSCILTATARLQIFCSHLAVVKLALNQVGLNASLGQSVCCAGARGTSSNNPHTQLPVQHCSILDSLHQDCRSPAAPALAALTALHQPLSVRRGRG